MPDDLDAEYAYLGNPDDGDPGNPSAEGMARLAAAVDLRCAMHERAGEIRGVTRVAVVLRELRGRLDLGEGAAFVDGMLLAADTVVRRLRAEVVALGEQLGHVAGATDG